MGLKEDLDAVADHELISVLLQMMEDTGADFTLTFRQLGDVAMKNLKNPDVLGQHWSLQRLAGHAKYNTFIDAYENRLKKERGKV